MTKQQKILIGEEFRFSGRKLTDVEKRWLSGVQVTSITQDTEQLKQMYETEQIDSPEQNQHNPY